MVALAVRENGQCFYIHKKSTLPITGNVDSNKKLTCLYEKLNNYKYYVELFGVSRQWNFNVPIIYELSTVSCELAL